MAGIDLVTTCGSQALSAATAKTVLQLIAASNHRVKLFEFAVAFDGATNTAVPVLCQLIRQSDAGSGSSSATVTKEDESVDETLQTTAIKGCTSEPTGSTVVYETLIHPQGGLPWQSPFGKEFKIKGGTRLGFVFTAPAGVNVRVTARCEE